MQSPNLKLEIKFESIKQKVLLIKVIYEIGPEKYLKSHVNKTFSPITYKIKDLQGEQILGTYYEHELQLIKDDEIYEIDSVLDRRTRREGKKIIKEIKVNWKGYPKKFQSWIPESYLV